MKPLVSCLCPTYGRPPSYVHLLEEAVFSFLLQDYPSKELVVLNDTPGQSLVCDAPGVRVVNLPSRVPSLGRKRDLLCGLARGEILLPWDDDDLSLPHRASQAVARLDGYDYFNPRRSWFWDGNGAHSDHGHGVCHNASAFTRRAWEAVGGYPDESVTEDQSMDRRLSRSVRCTPRLSDDPREWSYVYRWGVSDCHISGNGDHERAWRERGEAPFPPGTYRVTPGWRIDYLDVLRKHLV